MVNFIRGPQVMHKVLKGQYNHYQPKQRISCSRLFFKEKQHSNKNKLRAKNESEMSYEHNALLKVNFLLKRRGVYKNEY